MRIRGRTASQVFVYIPGNRWEDVEGTDQRLAAALAEDIPVLWVDPSLPVHRAFGSGAQQLFRGMEMQEVARGVTRIRWLFVPGAARAPLAHLTSAVLSMVVRAGLRRMDGTACAIMCSSPVMSLPDRISGTKVLYVTDDWVAGAAMMGLSPRLVRQNLARNLRRANITLAVSPHLVGKLNQEHAPKSAAGLLPNGCAVPAVAPRSERAKTAALVGTLNERLDIGLLEKLAQSSVPMLVIGPRADKDPAMGKRLDRFLAADSVRWLGEVPAATLPLHLSQVSVGLTPYVDSEFNRASFPLKTLEYLAAGLPVVATDLPAVRWLDSGFVAVAKDSSDFVGLVHSAMRTSPDPTAEGRRRDFARTHAWTARSSELLALVRAATPPPVRAAKSTTDHKPIAAALPEE
jgi:teichuronic acid biosynthesis glycosyltransferase TuaH